MRIFFLCFAKMFSYQQWIESCEDDSVPAILKNAWSNESLGIEVGRRSSDGVCCLEDAVEIREDACRSQRTLGGHYLDHLLSRKRSSSREWLQ